MSAQPDMDLENVDTEPLRLALWRQRHTAKNQTGVTGIAEVFVTEARKRGGQDFDLAKAFRVINAVTATRFTLGVLPRWVAEALAVALSLDPTILRAEGSAPAPLRPVPSPGTWSASHGAARTGAGEDRPGPAAGPASPRPRPGQGNHDGATSAGGTDLIPAPASPATRVCARCGTMGRDGEKPIGEFRTVGVTVGGQPSYYGCCRECEREKARGDQPPPAPGAKKYPCRKPDCRGGSDKNEIGRDQHEVLTHGGLYGPRAPHSRRPPRPAPSAFHPCPWCEGLTFKEGAALIDHLQTEHGGASVSPPPELVLAETSASFKVSVTSILSASRVQKTTLARQVAMYLCRELCGMGVVAVGEFFDREHTTVTHAEQRVQGLIDQADPVGVQVQILRTRIRTTYHRAQAPAGAPGGRSATPTGDREGSEPGEDPCPRPEPALPTPADEPEWEWPDA
jgi:hypothetical protein